MGNPLARIAHWGVRQFVAAGAIAAAVVLAGLFLGPEGHGTVPHLWAWYHYRAGVAALDRYHSAEALNHFHSCLQVWGTSIPTHVLASRAARRLGDYEEARQHLNECQNLLKGTNSDVALEDALLRTSMGELDQFEGFLRTRMEREPQRAPLILESLAEGYSRMYRMLESMVCLTQWLEFDPDNVQALFLRGRAQQQVRTWEKAAADFRRVLELDAERNDARERLVLCLLENSRFEEALSQLEYLERQGHDSPDLRVRMARCYHGMGQINKPRQILEAVLQDHPDHGQALLLLGRILLSAGQPVEAEPWLRKAVAALPYDYQAQWQLYQALNRQDGRGAEAQQELTKAEALRAKRVRMSDVTAELSMRPNDPALHYEMGTLLMKLGNRALGARWLGSALMKKRDYQPARDALIAYFEETGDKEKADALRQDAEAPSEER